jgi:alkanesulfonate monooxygenase SsuD/methylene tetrahydromethanopterin reductase-like flavin-dependent oxidoreductase (luciferase family)
LFEAWTLLAGLATRTERIRIGILVSCNTFRHPSLLAKQAATLDHVSNGRLEFGLGAGWFVPEHEMFGVPFFETPELIARFREAVELIDALFRLDTDDPADGQNGVQYATYAGQYYQLREAPFRPPTVQRPRPPFTLGAHGRKMMRIVAAHADRWNTVGTVEEARQRNDLLNDACMKINRDPATILRSVLYVPTLIPSEAPWDSLDAFRDFVGRYHDAGMREFLFQPPPPERFEIVERVATEVIPALRGAAAVS